MNAVTEAFVEEEDFFAPANTDMLSSMVARYQFDRKRIQEVVDFANGDACRNVLHHFLNGNATDDRGRVSMNSSANQLFGLKGAISSLNATYWSEALNLTEVYNAMPQDRRNSWNEQITNPKGTLKNRSQIERERNFHPELFDEEGNYLDPANSWANPPLPDFEEDTVRATLNDLLAKRSMFLAERVDGIFRALSGEHITNSPAGFSKRMIVANLITSYDTTNYDRVGYINDLRCVIAKFMGRDEPKHYASTKVVESARKHRRGEWINLDGGALRLRAYKCGTAHLEVHPDMAWRLNQILAYLHPTAIPAEFRQKPKKKPKDFVMMNRPLPFTVVEIIAELEREPDVKYIDRWTPPVEGNTKNKNSMRFHYRYLDEKFKTVREEAERVLIFIGGVKMSNGRGHSWYEFDYDPRDILDEIVCNGAIPDQTSYQFYPTPEKVARLAIEMADIGQLHTCLEPSAGQGALAELMPMDRTECVEISSLQSKILEAKGHKVTCMDFMHFSMGKFDRIVMNPPFSSGRWQAHITHASSMLSPGGRLVAIVPASARGKDILPGMNVQWSRVIENEFDGTTISVVILAAEHKQ